MILVLSAGKQHGKDTFAELLQEAFPEKNFIRKAFADKMKEITSQLLGCNLEEIEKTKVQEDLYITNSSVFAGGRTMRGFLQVLGQMMKDTSGDEQIWSQILTDDLVKDQNYVVTDCRFPFELQHLRDFGEFMDIPVISVRITNPRVSLGTDMHTSEQNYQKIEYDFEIINDGSLEEFKEKIKILIEGL